MNVLCVCTGNICRSPMLTVLLRDALAKEGLSLSVNGAGIPDPYGQDLATYRACRDSLIEALPQLIEDIKAQL